MHKSLSVATILLVVFTSNAQSDSLSTIYARTITKGDLMRHLNILAADDYEGREAGYPGQKRAAEYIKQQFIGFGIPPVPDAEEHGLIGGYFQPFELSVRTPGGLYMQVDGVPFRFMEDVLYFSEKMDGRHTTNEVVVVAAPNNEEDPFAGLDLKGKVVLVVDPVVISPDGQPDPMAMRRMSALGPKAQKAEAKILLFASTSFGPLKDTYAHYLTSTRMELKKENVDPPKGIQSVVISVKAANAILSHMGWDMEKAMRKGNRKRRVNEVSCSLELVGKPLMSTLTSENVLGFMQGSEIPEEVVVVTAHYDHIGVHGGEVYNGADDDGSGTVALIEMAEAFSMAAKAGHGPRRSVLFMPVSAEEKGLLGSEFYSDNPVFPLENTVADLNIDMIGRFDSTHTTSAPYVYIIGSDRLSSELHTINEEANAKHVGLILDNTFNAKDDPNRFYYRSDHYNFAKHGVPSIFYFSGVHEDYHQPGDEVDKIIPDLLEMRTKLVFHTAWELANRPERIVVDKPVEEDEP